MMMMVLCKSNTITFYINLNNHQERGKIVMSINNEEKSAIATLSMELEKLNLRLIQDAPSLYKKLSQKA